MSSLKDKVALVTGASRGAGRAIAAVLGEAGATVYVTGRTARNAPAVDGLPGTVDDAADEVSLRGGHGIAVHCDHTVDQDVEALFERIRAELTPQIGQHCTVSALIFDANRGAIAIAHGF